MYILVVEDDHLQRDPIHHKLKQEFPRAKVECIKTESEFRFFFDSGEGELPDLIVMDVMVRWARLTETMPEPPEAVVEGKYYRAGFRCEKFLADRERTKGIPVILYTILEHDDLEEDLKTVRQNTVYLRKTPYPDDLFKQIRSLTSLEARQPLL